MGEGLEGRGEEHGFIVGVSYEEDDALVGEERGRRGGGERGGEVPESEEEDGEGEEKYESGDGHGGSSACWPVVAAPYGLAGELLRRRWQTSSRRRRRRQRTTSPSPSPRQVRQGGGSSLHTMHDLQ